MKKEKLTLKFHLVQINHKVVRQAIYTDWFEAAKGIEAYYILILRPKNVMDARACQHLGYSIMRKHCLSMKMYKTKTVNGY